MAFKNNSVPSFIARHEYKSDVPGYALPSGLSITRVVPPAFANLASAQGWTSLDTDSSTAQAVCQVNANEIWQSIKALAGLIALMNCVTPGPYQDTHYANTATYYGGGALSGSGSIVTLAHDYELGAIQTPCWLYIYNSKWGYNRVASIVYKIVDHPESNYAELHLLQPIGDLQLEKIDTSEPLTGLLYGYPIGSEQWVGINTNSDPRDYIQRLLYCAPFRKEQVNVFGSAPEDFTLTRLGTNVGHPSLASLVNGIPDATGVRFPWRQYGLGTGGWSKCQTTVGISGQPVVMSCGGFEFLDVNSTGGAQDLLYSETWTQAGPAGGTRQTNQIDWANTTADDNNDPYLANRNSVLRGLQSVHRYTRAITGGQGPWEFKRTWLLFPDLPTADGEYLYPDGRVVNGYWDANGNVVTSDDPACVARRMIEITHGIEGTKSETVREPAAIRNVTVGNYSYCSHPTGANYFFELKHGGSTFAKNYTENEQDDTVTCYGAGLIVLPKSGSRWTNYLCVASVEGQGGFIHAGHCLRVPNDESIPVGLRGRLLPIVRAEAGAGNDDPDFDGSILDSGIVGKPNGYEVWAARMDVVWVIDAYNTISQLEAASVDVGSMTFEVVRGAKLSNVFGVYASTSGATASTPVTPVTTLTPTGRIYLADRAACLSVDCAQYVEQPSLSVSGDRLLKVAENIFANGYDFDFTGGLPADGTSYLLSVYIYKPNQYVPPEHDWEYNELSGAWTKIEGNRSYGFSFSAGYGTEAQVGTALEGEAPDQAAYCVYYVPLASVTSPELDRCPVGSDGIAAAYGNVTLNAPHYEEYAFVEFMNDYFNPPRLDWTWDSSTLDNTSIDIVLLGLKTDSGGNYQYATLGAGAGAGSQDDGIPRKQDLTDWAKAYVDNKTKYQAFVNCPVATGLSITPTQAIGPDFMMDLLNKTWTNSFTWDESGNRTSGETRAKRLTFTGVGISQCHVELDPAAFELPADCRVV